MPDVKIKICGLTRIEDILVLRDLPVDFAGFIFVPSSPRFINPERAAGLIERLPEKIKPVGVFMDEGPEVVRRTVEICGLEIIQFHGQESPEFCDQFNLPYFKAIRVGTELDEKDLAGYRPRAYLLDTFIKEADGGTGKTFDWTLAKRMVESGRPIILAGGLKPENVSAAVKIVRPWGVDVSSGVESKPGVKDKDKIIRFVANLTELLPFN